MKTVQFLVLLIITCTISSCYGDCACWRDLGCKILTVKKSNRAPANMVILTKTFCSQVDYHVDRALIDSVDAFQKRYTSDSTYVDTRDSIYKQYGPVSVKRNVNRYTDSGYWCNCPR